MSFSRAINLFFSCLFLIFVGASSMVLFLVSCLIWLATRMFDKRMIILNLFSSLWASIYIWVMPLWSVNITGREKMNMKKSYVVVSNHQSQLDILVAYRLFFPFRWISKAEVFKLPVLGWNMQLNGYVKLIRGDKESIKKMFKQCEDLLAQNISIMIFPEGTRSRTGIVKAFKPGAFILAKKMKKPILPMVINNTKDALPKHSLRFHGRHRMELEVLDEIPYARFKDMEIDALSDMVQKMIGSRVKEHSPSCTVPDR